MKKIIPYKTTRGALVSLDNGGRFYNFASKARDGEVSSAELAKAAGVFSSKQQMMLFLAMSISELAVNEQKKVLESLSDDLKAVLQKYRPQHLVPSEARSKGKLASSAIVTGVPKMVDSKTDFNGFIMVPIMSGKTMTFVMIPLIDQYDVYELRDEKSSKEFLIAHARGGRKLPESPVRAGGVLKELKNSKDKNADATVFLETLYYSLV